VAAGGGALGVDTLHLNHDVALSGGGTGNQIEALVRRGVVDAASVPADVAALGGLVDPADAAASVETRARSYLHSQCAQCHNRDFGTGQGDLDLRWGKTFADMRLCNAAPTQGDLGIAGAKLLAPGAPERSLVWLRVHSLKPAERMPPLASARRDPLGEALLRDWIAALRACP
jgi:hypothetical protein